MKLPLFVLAAVVALSSAHVSAKVISFPADNFSIDAPEGWVPVPLPPMPPGCHVLTAARDAASGNVYSVIKGDLGSSPRPNAFFEGMLKPLTAKGWKASPLRDETIDGRPFSVFTVSRQTGSPVMLMATTFAGQSAYAVETVSPNGDVEKQPVLNAIVQSFHFLQPVRSIGRHDPNLLDFSNPFNISYQLGRLVGILVIAIVVISVIKKLTQSSR